jgi:hypothetical protein
VVAPLEGELRLRRLSAANADEACAEPESFRTDAEDVSADGELALRLEPYEVVRIDSA